MTVGVPIADSHNEFVETNNEVTMNSKQRLYCPAFITGDVIYYYTGKAGEQWLSTRAEDGFFGYTKERAEEMAKSAVPSRFFDHRMAIQQPLYHMTRAEMDKVIADGVEFCVAWLQGKLRKTGMTVDGDYAAHFFQGENMEKLNEVFAEYLSYELETGNSSVITPESD